MGARTARPQEWVREFPEFQERYTAAKQSYVENMVEEIIEIADDGGADIELSGEDEDGLPRVKVDSGPIR
jgi:Bacteriophage Sf6, terminase small subunit-like